MNYQQGNYVENKLKYLYKNKINYTLLDGEIGDDDDTKEDESEKIDYNKLPNKFIEFIMIMCINGVSKGMKLGHIIHMINEFCNYFNIKTRWLNYAGIKTILIAIYISLSYFVSIKMKSSKNWLMLDASSRGGKSTTLYVMKCT